MAVIPDFSKVDLRKTFDGTQVGGLRKRDHVFTKGTRHKQFPDPRADETYHDIDD
jgi:hypothetical protein